MSKINQWEDRIGRRLKLRDLHILMAVAQNGGIGKAAQELNVSQPAVSKAIANIEHALGVRLLDRTTLGVEPTLYGRALLKWGAAVFDDLRQGVREIEHLADPAVGEVRIGSSEAMTAGLVPAVIDRLASQFPRLAFSVRQATDIASQYRDLRERNVDLILGRMMTPISNDDLSMEVLFDDPLYVVGGGANRLVRRRRIEPAELINELWCLPPYESFVGSLIREAFRSIGLEAPQQTVTSTSIQMFTYLLATGRFLSVLSGSTMKFSAKRLGLKIVPVDLSIRAGPVGIVTLKSRTLSPTVELFMDCARAVSAPLAGIGRSRRSP